MTAAEQRKKKAQQMADYYAARGDSTRAGAKAAQRAVSKADGKTPYSASGAAVQKYRANKPTTVQDLYANRPTRQNNQTQAPNPALAQSIVNTVLGTGRGRSVIAGVDNAHKIAGQEPNQQIRIQPGAARNSSARQQMEAAQTKELGSVERIGTLERIGKSARSGLKDWAAGYMDYAAAGTAAENRAGTELTRSALAGYKKQLDNERAVMASYERGEGLYDEKDYAVAREQAENLRRYINAYDKALGANEEISGQTAAESEKLKQSAAMDSEEATSGLGKVGTRLIRGVGTTVQNLLDSAVGGFGPRAAYPSIAARVYGQATQNALNDGKSREGAVRYGLAQAAAELAPELFFSGNPLTDAADGGIVSEAAESLLSNPRAKKLRDVLGAIGESKYVNNFLTKLGADAFGEGVEEVVTQGLNDIIDRITYGDEKDRSTPQDYAEAFWGGVIGSVYGNALRPSGVINNAREDIAGLRQQTSQNSVDDAINRLAQSTGDNPEALRNVIAPVWQNEQRLINNLAAYYAGERGLTPADAASVAQSFATRFYSDLAAEQQAASQPAQQTAQEAAQQAPQGIATNAENAPSGVFNTAQDAQEAKPTQTVADIYANRPTRQQNIDNAAQAGYTNNSIDSVSGGVTDDAGRSAETNRDGVSGSDQTGYAVGQRRTGLDRASVGPRFVLSDQAKSTIQSRGVAFAETHDVSADSAAFSAALDEARASDAKNGWAVSPKAQQEIDENGIRVYMNENSSVGFGIAPDGDIEAVFANKQKGAPKGSAASIIPQAIAAGGTKLDCYGKVLVDIYSLGGFVPVARVAFNPEYANDGWDASKGTPYIYFMMATDTDADSVVANYGKYKVWTQAELDALPLMEYDEAYAYRDSLLVQRQGEAVAASPAVTQSQNTATATDGRDMGSVSPEDSTGAAPAGFDPVSQWQMEADAYHPVNEAAAQTTMEERGRAPMDIPTTDRNGRQVSKLVSTLVNANITTNEAASALAEDARNGVFSAIPYTDDAAAQKAEEHIGKVGWDVAFGEYQNEVMSGKVSKDINMMGIALYNNAVNAGALADAMDVISLLAKSSRTSAQSLQVLNMINKSSPESQLYLAMRGLGTLVEDAQKRYGKRAENVSIDEALLQEYKDALMSGDEKAAEKAWNQVIRDVAQQIPSSFAEKLNNWRYLAMLGNPRTHVRNFAGNLGFAPVRFVSNMISTGIQSVVLDKTNRRRAFMNFAKAENKDRFKEAWKYYGKAMDNSQSGGKYSDAMNELDAARTIYKFKPLEAIHKGNSKALDVEDQWFSQPAFAYALSSYMAAHNIPADALKAQTMSADLAKGIEYAVNQAEKATYRDSNAFSDWVTRAGENNKVTKAAKSAVLPFKRTPANILVRGVEYSPVGFVKGLTYDLAQVKKGNMTAAEAIDNISAGFTGTGLLALGVYLASQGLISAGDDPEDDEQNWFNDLMGYQSYALNVGDKSVTIDWLAPEVMPLFVGVELQKAFEDKKMNLSEALQALGRVTNPMIETSMLSSIDDLMDAVANANGNKDYAMALLTSAAASYIGQYIPTLFGQIERTAEDKRYETYRYNDTGVLGLSPSAQRQVGKIMNKLPGEFGQIPYIDAWGREQESGNIGTRIWNNFFNPAYVNDIQRGKVEEELQRLHDEGYTGVLPDRPSQSTKIQQFGGEHMTKEEYVQYARTQGGEALKMISGFLDSDYYDTLTDDQRNEVIHEIYSLSKDEAKRKVVEGRGIEYSSGYDKYQSIEDPALYMAMKESLDQLRKSNGVDNEAFTAVYNDWRHLSAEEKKKYTDGVEGEFDGIDTLKKLNSCINGGLSTEQFYKAKNAHDEIDDLGLKASEERARFANWLDRESGFTTAEKRTALANFKYTTTLVADEGNYEKMTEAGVSANGSLALFNTMQKLEPAEGYTDVAGWQKYEAITSSGLTDDEQLAALSVYATDSAYDYYQAAYGYGVAPSKWSDVLANIRGYEGTLKSDGKSTYSANVSQESLCRAMFDAGLSDAQAEAMYNEYSSARNWKNTYYQAMRNVNWAWYGYKTR